MLRKLLYATPVLALGLLLLFQLKTAILVTESARLGRSELPATVLWGDSDQMAWMLNANEGLKEGPKQVKYASWDCYPEGRAVHWSSIIILGLQTGTKVIQALTHEPDLQAMETAAPLVYSAIYLVFLSMLLLLTLRGYGMRIGYLAFFGTVLAPNIWRAWHPYWLDHHGMEYYSFAIILYGLLLMWHTNSPKAAIFSGFGTGLALWIGALSNLPILAIAIFGTFSAQILTIYTKEKAGIKPSTWIIWGLTASITSLAAYVFEYHGNWSFRLEVNNPLYSTSLLAGSVILALAANSVSSRSITPKQTAIAIFATIVLLLPALVYSIYGKEIFTTGEEFSRLIASTVGGTRVSPERVGVLIALPVLAGVTLIFYRSAILIIPLICFVLLYMFTSLYIRVLPYCEVACVACGITVLLTNYTNPRKWAIVLLSLAIIIGAAEAISGIPYEKNFGRIAIAPYAEYAKTARATASTIIQDAKQRNAPIHIASNLNNATPLAYYTGGTVSGAIYWEAIKGIEATNKIFANENLSEVPKILKEKGVNYIVINQEGTIGPAYLRFGLKGYDIIEELSGRQILRHTPPWLEKISPQGSKLDVYYFSGK